MPKRAAIILLMSCLPGAGGASAQSTQTPFGGLTHDSSLPVEIASDTLNLDQADGSALFSGNVVVGQGDMRLSANQIRVEYSRTEEGGTGRISRLVAEGDVALVSGAEVAEAQNAVYTIDSGVVVLTGDVILIRGQSTLTANRMVIDLNSGSARIVGRVRTILKTGGE